SRPDRAPRPFRKIRQGCRALLRELRSVTGGTANNPVTRTRMSSDGRSHMDGKAWRVTVVGLLTGLMIGMPGVGRAADGENDDPALAALFEDAPARPGQLIRVEWVASPGRSGRSRLE